MHKHSFEAIGTHWTIEMPGVLPVAIQTEVGTRIADFDRVYSRFRDDSLVARLRTPGTYEFPSDAVKLIDFYKQLYEVTDGAVTPLVGGALEAAGYDASYSLQQKGTPHKVPKWDEVMSWTGSHVTTLQPIVLDVGAAGKGCLVDLIANIFGSHNIESYVIDASGDILQRGPKPEKIGLENPYDPTRILGITPLHNQSLCASASNRRAWGNWHHIIDARTGQPVRDVIATWVVADSTMIADGLATALFFVGLDRLQQWEFQAVRLFADGRIEQTDNFVGELYI